MDTHTHTHTHTHYWKRTKHKDHARTVASTLAPAATYAIICATRHVRSSFTNSLRNSCVYGLQPPKKKERYLLESSSPLWYKKRPSSAVLEFHPVFAGPKPISTRIKSQPAAEYKEKKHPSVTIKETRSGYQP